MRKGATEKCAHCGRDGKVGSEMVPYLVGEKVIPEKKRFDRKKKQYIVRPASTKPIHRWLCGVQTGRDCSRVWHEKWREWKADRANGR